MRLPRARLAAPLLLALCGFASATELPKVKAAPVREPIAAAPAASAPSVAFRKLATRPTNDKVGSLQTGIFCGSSQDLRWTAALSSLVTRDIARVTRKELDAAGYPKPNASESVFQTASTPVAADYEIGVTLRDVQVYACERNRTVEGGIWLQMQWELFSPQQQKVLYSVTTEGSAQTADGEKPTFGDLAQKALASAVRNLLAESAFSEQARVPVDPGLKVAAAAEAAARLPLAHSAKSGGPVQERMPQLQSAVVTLLSGSSSGSGFYIDGQGYLLTNQHVVGDAKYLKVKLASGRELVGEVLRSDRSRDVALVKTEPVQLAVLEVSTDEPRVGADVYALGSPLGESFAASLTRGVLSGVRSVERQTWLQSDVRILPGSSGGPLLGSDGLVLGMASRGVGAGMAGINLFIPIREALDTLRIDARPD